MKTFVIGDVHGRRDQLRRLIEMLPRNPATDTLVLLGDLIDRGEDAPGVVEDVVRLYEEATRQNSRVIVLRGNHEQMLLDFIDKGATLWLHPAVGSDSTWEQYVGSEIDIDSEEDIKQMQEDIRRAVPAAHIEFFRRLPLYHEDQYAFYVHAGLEGQKHPRDTEPRQLLWSRDPNFFKHYYGKPCIFGHTPTPLLPLLGRIGRHGIYISHSAIGVDTGYSYNCPLTCLQLPDFIIYQTFADGRTATHHITNFIPEPLRAFRREAAMHISK
ncbi:MAG TPA: metallophosphoesterase family protein [Pyrinomonadaceae bacterium]|jgi:serine/threonine protein phosphatase 1